MQKQNNISDVIKAKTDIISFAKAQAALRAAISVLCRA